MSRNARRFLCLHKKKAVLEQGLCDDWGKLYNAQGKVIGTHKEFMKLNATCMNLRLVNSELHEKRAKFKKALQTIL